VILRMAPKKASAQKQTAKAKAKRAPTAPRRKKAAKSTKMPRQVSAMWPVPVASRSGVATAYPQETRIDMSTFTNKDQLFFFGLDGATATYGAGFIRTGGTATLETAVYNLPAVDGSAVASSANTLYPTSGRAMTFEFKLLNATPLVNVGGRVYFLRLDQRLALGASPSSLSGIGAQTDVTAFDNLINTILTSPNVECHSHAEYMRPESEIPWQVSRVIDRPTYESFEAWTSPHPKTAAGADAYMKEHALWPSQTGSKRGMTGYAVYLPRTTQPQDVTLVFKVSHYFRWPLQSIGAALHKEIPVGKNPSTIPDAPTMPPRRKVFSVVR